MKQFLLMILILGSFLMANEDREKSEIDGRYLEAYSVAVEDFLKIKDLTKEQKSLKYYMVEFSENNESYFIQFVGKLMSEEDMAKYKRMIFGREVKYTVSKKDMNVTMRLFAK